MSRGIFGLLASLLVLLALDLTAVMEGLAFLAIVLTGPILFGLYVTHVSYSSNSDFNGFSRVHRLKFYGVLVSMILSIGSITIYIFNNPQLIWS